MMTSEQRYFFDLTGYLHLKNVLNADELHQAQEAADRYIQTPPDALPAGFAADQGNYTHGFAFDRVLEVLTMHPTTWPIIKELTNDKPQLVGGSLRVNTREHCIVSLNCTPVGKKIALWSGHVIFVEDGRIYCDDLVFFFYLTDVLPGDGGLVVVPGSHKSEFKRPENFFVPDSEGTDPQPHPAVVNITPRAGDVVVITEMLTHGVLIWKPEDRDRRFLILRYRPQHMLSLNTFPEDIKARLSPETLELIENVPYYHVKEIVKPDRSTT